MLKKIFLALALILAPAVAKADPLFHPGGDFVSNTSTSPLRESFNVWNSTVTGFLRASGIIFDNASVLVSSPATVSAGGSQIYPATGTPNFQYGFKASTGVFTVSVDTSVVQFSRTYVNALEPALRIDDNSQNSNALFLNSNHAAPNSVSIGLGLGGSRVGLISAATDNIYMVGNGGINFELNSSLNRAMFRNVFSASDITINFNTSGNDANLVWSSARDRFETANKIQMTNHFEVIGGSITTTGPIKVSSANVAQVLIFSTGARWSDGSFQVSSPTSVSNSDASLTVVSSTITQLVSINTNHSNTFTATQFVSSATPMGDGPLAAAATLQAGYGASNYTAGQKLAYYFYEVWDMPDGTQVYSTTSTFASPSITIGSNGDAVLLGWSIGSGNPTRYRVVRYINGVADYYADIDPHGAFPIDDNGFDLFFGWTYRDGDPIPLTPTAYSMVNSYGYNPQAGQVYGVYSNGSGYFDGSGFFGDLLTISSSVIVSGVGQFGDLVSAPYLTATTSGSIVGQLVVDSIKFRRGGDVQTSSAPTTGGSGGSSIYAATGTALFTTYGFKSSTGTFTALTPGVMHIVATSSNVAVLPVSLSTEVFSNLPVTNLNSGTSATFQTAWAGDGTWRAFGTPLTVATGTASNVTNNVSTYTQTLSFSGAQFQSVQSGTTNFTELNRGTVTVLGNLVISTNAVVNGNVLMGTGTAQGSVTVYVAGTGRVITAIQPGKASTALSAIGVINQAATAESGMLIENGGPNDYGVLRMQGTRVSSGDFLGAFEWGDKTSGADPRIAMILGYAGTASGRGYLKFLTRDSGGFDTNMELQEGGGVFMSSETTTAATITTLTNTTLTGTSGTFSTGVQSASMTATTNLNIPSGTNPTVTAPGAFANDISSFQIVAYNGAGTVVLSSRFGRAFAFPFPVAGDRLSHSTIYDVTVSSVIFVSSSTTNCVMSVKDCAASDPTSCNNLASSITASTTSFSVSLSSTVADRRRIWVSIDSVSGSPGSCNAEVVEAETRK